MDWEAYEAARPIIVADELRNPHPITCNTAARYGLPFAFATPVASDGNRHLRVNVSPHHADLALRIVDAFVRACEVRGFELRHHPHHHESNGLLVYVEGEAFPMRLCEYRSGKFPRVLTLEIARPTYIQLSKRSWQDRPRHPLAERLNEVMLALRAEVAARNEARLAREAHERRIAVLHEKREELRECIEEEEGRIVALREEAQNWRDAQIIREYVAALEARASGTPAGEERAGWYQWAREQADRLDPLTPSPPSILDTHEDEYRELGLSEYLEEDGTIGQA